MARATKRSRNIPADPTRRLATLFHELSDSIEEDHLRKAKENVLQLLDEASALNDLAIWGKLRVPSLPRHVLPVPSEIDRCDEIQDSRDELDENGDLKSVLQAMDVVDRVLRSMQVQFRRGHLPRDWAADLEEDDAGLQRYMCAAILPAVVELLDEVWSPLHDEFRRNARSNRGSG